MKADVLEGNLADYVDKPTLWAGLLVHGKVFVVKGVRKVATLSSGLVRIDCGSVNIHGELEVAPHVTEFTIDPAAVSAILRY